ncbi:DUF1772 domain-containing protein [Actinokineospora guangxiensis]|uniref:DUF1772 domain-containing protein n=1 Tax=Actinokineospora guangxiensis TaxID=1490288 RepID=A0ABW0ET40_9PSEU
MSDVVLIATTVASGLIAGLYFAFSISVMLALGEVDDRAFVDTMQRINRRIQNAVFGVVFAAAPIGSIAIAVMELLGDDPRWPVLAGAVLTVAATLITITVNVPLNNALEAAGPVADGADLAAVRAAFEPRWVRFNHVRGIVSTAGVAFFCAGL